MKWGSVLVVLVVLVAGFYFVPQMIEGTSDSCTALAQLGIRRSGGSHGGIAAMLSQTIGQTLGGPIMRAKMEQEHPNLPPGLACATDYWRSFMR